MSSSTSKNVTIPAFIKNYITSRDGTTIGYLQLGNGPGVILLHGGMKASQDLMKLAIALSKTFTLYIPDRRGRGLSGPHGDHFSIMSEVEDMQAIITKTGANNIFGHSSGALITLRTALATPTIQNVALYEPPFSVNGSIPTSWVPRYDREIAEGNLAAALITALKGTKMEPTLGNLPRFILMPIMSLGMRAKKDVCALIPTQHFDMQVVKDMSDTLQDYSSLQAQVLLLGGTKSPAFF